jgi:hypothetical protein
VARAKELLQEQTGVSYTACIQEEDFFPPGVATMLQHGLKLLVFYNVLRNKILLQGQV